MLKRDKLIFTRLSVHKAMTDQFIANGQTPEAASEAAFKIVRPMSQAKLDRYRNQGR